MPLRILIINNLYPPQVVGGYERAIADYARLLHQRGHHILVLTGNCENLPTQGSHLTESEPFPVQRCFDLCGTWGTQGAHRLKLEEVTLITFHNRKKLLSELLSFQPDVCLAGNIDFLGIELIERVLACNVPVAHYVMNPVPGYPCEWTPLVRSYQYITCSNWIRDNLQIQGHPVTTAQTIYPGADVEYFYEPELPPRDALKIAYASLLMPYKGADVLAETLILLNTMGIEFSATFAGGTSEPDYVQAIREMIADEGLSDRVHFPGVLTRSELKTLYSTHNILVFPSRFQEPFGISQVEAMAAGLTVVTSGTGGSSEIITSGENGLIFESENPLDLSDQLISLLLEPNEWERMSRNGQNHALNTLSHGRTIEQLEDVFQNLIKQKSSPRFEDCRFDPSFKSKDTKVKEKTVLLPRNLKLHIGGTEAHPDWNILDIENRPEVNFVGNASNLSQFPNESIKMIYASHVLEHFHYRLNDELISTLTEWHRVLETEGKLFLSVPDLQILCHQFTQPNLLVKQRLHLMQVMFGGQQNQYDVHYVGFDFEMLSLCLEEAGFSAWERVEQFGLFQDTSCLKLFGEFISLNVIATK